jgi:hypothetical protein
MSVQEHIGTAWKTKASFSLSLKCAVILLLFSLSVLIVACSSGAGGSSTDLGNPQVTVTIQLGANGSPTPPLPNYWCGAWATQTSPVYNSASTVGVYAKFVHTMNQNPVGVAGASATAIVHWADGTSNTQTAATTPDGLAVFSIPTGGRAADINTVTLIEVDFVAKDGTTCKVQNDRQAFFTLTGGSSTATATMTLSPTASPTGIANPTPTCTPLPRPLLKKNPTPTPKPTPNPTPRSGC